MTLPRGYTWLAEGDRRIMVRDDLVPALGPWLLAPRLDLDAASPLAAGRGGAYRLRLAGVPAAVVRLGRRGGAIAQLVRETYVGLRPRPWREVAVSAIARERGAAVAEVLGARVEGWIAYRSAIVSAEVPEAATAFDALRASPAHERPALAAAAATAVAGLHAAGVVHADLNLTNILIAGGAGTIVDLDRARLRPEALYEGERRQSLARLCRSARKLDPGGSIVDPDTVRAFREAYGSVTGAPCAS